MTLSEQEIVYRLNSFLFDQPCARSRLFHVFYKELTCFLERYDFKRTDIAVVGGFIRDIAFQIDNKDNDIDLVIDCKQHILENFIKRFKCSKKNRHGGFSVTLHDGADYLKVDFWALKNTWTHKYAHINMNSVEDIIDSVFFSCDQIAYNINTRALIHSEDYFDNLRKRNLSIIVEKTPNVLGNMQKAREHIKKYGFRPDEKMQSFLHEHG